MRGSFLAGTNPTEMLKRPSVTAQSSQLGSSFSSHLSVEELASERKKKGERESKYYIGLDSWTNMFTLTG